MQGQKTVCQSVDRWVLPEEGVVLNADLPQSLRGPVVGQLEAYGALKLFVLSGEGKGVEEEEEEEEGEEEKESEGNECGARWREGGRVNCVYSAAVEKSMLFFCLEIYSPCLLLPRQVDFPSLTNPQIRRSCARSIKCSTVWTEKDALGSICY